MYQTRHQTSVEVYHPASADEVSSLKASVSSVCEYCYHHASVEMVIRLLLMIFKTIIPHFLVLKLN